MITKEAYKKKEAWGLLTSIDLSNCDPKLLQSPKSIKEFVTKLCDLINMKKKGV